MLGIKRRFIESCLLVILLTSLFILVSGQAAGQQPESPATQDVISKNTPAETTQPAQPATAVVAPQACALR